MCFGWSLILAMLWVCGGFVFETLEEFCNVFWHGNVKMMLFVDEIKCNTTVESDGPVFGTGVVLVDGVDEMVRILFPDILHARIVYT